MNEFLEFYRLTTVLLGKLSYAASAVICIAIIANAIERARP